MVGSLDKLISFSAGFNSMKKLEIYIPQERLEAINELLHKQNVGGMTYYDIIGRGRSKQESIDVERGDIYIEDRRNTGRN